MKIYTLTSTLHDEQAVAVVTREFLHSLDIEYDFRGGDFTDYGSSALSLIFVRTGGTEGIFRSLLPQLQAQSTSPFYLLASGKSNSLAASLEILSYLRQNGFQGEILHGDAAYISHRIQLLERVETARRALQGNRLGIIGAPSDWLISSDADKDKVHQRLGISLIDIPIDALFEELQALSSEQSSPNLSRLNRASKPYRQPSHTVRQALPGAIQIYSALKSLVRHYRLQGFTLRCFDLLKAVQNTGCLALAQLNAEGYVAGCEGDVPAMLSMRIAQALTGVSGFQANPARINPVTGEMLFAHCTIPFNMVERYELDTHFESGIGVGIRGYMKEGPVTLFKVSGDLTRCFIDEGELLRNQAQPDLCRTQQVIRLSDPNRVQYFFTNPIGNHHIILPGHHKEELTEMIGL